MFRQYKKCSSALLAIAAVAMFSGSTALGAIAWKGQNWDEPANGTATIVAGNLVLTRTSGTADVAVHVNRIEPLIGSDSFINANGTPWIKFSYIDNNEQRGVDMFIDDETLALNPRLQAGSLFSLQGLGYTKYGSGVGLVEEVVFAEGDGLRVAGQPHTIYVGQRADGTIDYNYDGTWFTSTSQKAGGAAPFDFNDVYLRLRGSTGTTATFTDFQYGDDHGVPPTNKNQCMNGGWVTLLRADGTSVTPQGDCIQYGNTGK